MADSDITVSDLTATPGIRNVALQWLVDDPHTPRGLPARQLANVELWAASTNNRDLATKVAEGRDNAQHMGLTEGSKFFYWIKARNRAGKYGDFYPASPTAGVQGNAIQWVAYTPVAGAITGTITSVTATGRYKLIDYTCAFELKISIAVNGTGADQVTVTLPFITLSGSFPLFVGFAASGATRYSVFAASGGASEGPRIWKYDGTYPGADNTDIYLAGVYEIRQ